MTEAYRSSLKAIVGSPVTMFVGSQAALTGVTVTPTLVSKPVADTAFTVDNLTQGSTMLGGVATSLLVLNQTMLGNAAAGGGYSYMHDAWARFTPLYVGTYEFSFSVYEDDGVTQTTTVRPVTVVVSNLVDLPIPEQIGINSSYGTQNWAKMSEIVSWVRISASWVDLETSITENPSTWDSGVPTPWLDIETSVTYRGPEEWNWAAVDDKVNAARDAGLKVLLLLAYYNPIYGTPPYATPGDPAEYLYPPDCTENSVQLAAYVRYCTEVVKRYSSSEYKALYGSDSIMYEIWNEPNTNLFWGYHPDLNAYSTMAWSVANAVYAIDPTVNIVLQEGGFTQEGYGLIRLDTLTDNGLVSQVNYVSTHPYRSTAPETFIPQFEYFKNKMSVPLIITELGYDYYNGAVVEHNFDKQAAYLIRTWLSGISTKCPMTLWYNWSDYSIDYASVGQFGLINYNSQETELWLASKYFVDTMRGYTFNSRIATSLSTFALLFTKTDSPNVIIAWDDLDTSTFTVPNNVSIRDIYGATVSHTGSTVNLTTSPIYITMPVSTKNYVIPAATLNQSVKVVASEAIATIGNGTYSKDATGLYGGLSITTDSWYADKAVLSRVDNSGNYSVSGTPVFQATSQYLAGGLYYQYIGGFVDASWYFAADNDFSPFKIRVTILDTDSHKLFNCCYATKQYTDIYTTSEQFHYPTAVAYTTGDFTLTGDGLFTLHSLGDGRTKTIEWTLPHFGLRHDQAGGNDFRLQSLSSNTTTFNVTKIEIVPPYTPLRTDYMPPNTYISAGTLTTIMLPIVTETGKTIVVSTPVVVSSPSDLFSSDNIIINQLTWEMTFQPTVYGTYVIDIPITETINGVSTSSVLVFTATVTLSGVTTSSITKRGLR